ADTAFPTAPTLDTVDIAGPTALDSLADSRRIEIADTMAAGAGGNPIVPLAGRPVIYTIVHPAVAGPVTLVRQDTAHAVATTDTASSNSSGVAFVKVRLLAPDTIPDSVVVVARAQRANHAPVPGSPATFVVRFRAVAVADTAHTLVTTDTVTTDVRGIAAVRLRLIAGPAPASVEVTASAKRGVSARLPGSPVRFTVRFTS